MTWCIRVRQGAARDIRSARRWYESQQLGLGRRFLLELQAVLLVLEQSPHGFHEISPGLRRVVMRRFPCVIYYRLQDADVVVLAVMHQSRLPDLGRLDG